MDEVSKNAVSTFPCEILPGIINKPWGWARRLFSTTSCEVYVIHAQKGGFSSIHEHEHTYNLIYVISGLIQVMTCVTTVADDTNFDALASESGVTLRPGTSLLVKPAKKHQFTALEDSDAIEIYYCDAPNLIAPNLGDISRYSIGGLHKS